MTAKAWQRCTLKLVAARMYLYHEMAIMDLTLEFEYYSIPEHGIFKITENSIPIHSYSQQHNIGKITTVKNTTLNGQQHSIPN